MEQVETFQRCLSSIGNRTGTLAGSRTQTDSTSVVDIDKNEHKRREGGPHVASLFKSRLVSRGDLEETTGVRTESPTCDIEVG